MGRRTVRGPAEFYLDGNPDSEWVQGFKSQQPFWVAIDPWGETRHQHFTVLGDLPTQRLVSAAICVVSLRRWPVNFDVEIPEP